MQLVQESEIAHQLPTLYEPHVYQVMFSSYQATEQESGDEQQGKGKENGQQGEGKENGQENAESIPEPKEDDKPVVNGHDTDAKNTAKKENFERKVLNMLKAYQLTKSSSEDQGCCDLYKSRQVVKWSFFSSKEDVDNLLEALNPRGFRERALKEAIQQEYKQLSLAVEKCPLKEEIQAQKKESKPKGRRGGRNQPTVDKSRYKTMEEFLEANLRDQILDLEDRIWQGNLGFVRAVDREAWRAKVENGIYSQFTKEQGSKDVKVNGVSEVKENGDADMMEVDTSVGADGKQSEDINSEKAEVKQEEEEEETPVECDEDQKPMVNGIKDEAEHEHGAGNSCSSERQLNLFMLCSALGNEIYLKCTNLHKFSMELARII